MNKPAEVNYVNCPMCKKKVEWSPTSLFRPFCSKRCQVIDLGEWAAEENRIPDKDCMADDLWSEDELAALDLSSLGKRH